MSKKHIISLGGELASGKGSVSKVLMERIKFGVYKNGDYFRKLARESGMDVTSFNIYVKEKYGFDDEICMAVRYHTIGNPNMSTFDKIIYIADKIGRKDKDEFIMNLKKIAYEDIDKAVYVFLLHQKEKFDKKNKSLSNSTLELLNLLQDKYSK